MNWDQYFMNLCYAVADKSKDRSTKVGCVVVGPNKEIRTTGFNGLPRGVIDGSFSEEEFWDMLIEREHVPSWVLSQDIVNSGITKEIMEPALEKLNAEIERRYEERPYKYKWVAHSEFNAVCNAARTGTSLDGCTMYVPFLPCSNCAMAIIQAGIIEVVIDGNFADNPELMARWAEEHAITNVMFEEARIVVRKSKKEKD